MAVKYNRGETWYSFIFKNGQFIQFEKRRKGYDYLCHIIVDIDQILPHAVTEELNILAKTPYTIGIFRLLAMNLSKSSKWYPTFERIATENGIEL